MCVKSTCNVIHFDINTIVGCFVDAMWVLIKYSGLCSFLGMDLPFDGGRGGSQTYSKGVWALMQVFRMS